MCTCLGDEALETEHKTKNKTDRDNLLTLPLKKAYKYKLATQESLCFNACANILYLKFSTRSDKNNSNRFIASFHAEDKHLVRK